jgi:hypothetical protein
VRTSWHELLSWARGAERGAVGKLVPSTRILPWERAFGASTILISCVLGSSREVGAQSADPHTAQPERPTVSTHAWTVAPGWLEIEAGGQRDHEDGRFRGFGAPVAAKIGLASRFQLTVSTSLNQPPEGGATSLGDTGIGLKWRFAENVPVAGALAGMATVELPTAPASGPADPVALSLLLISSHTFGPFALDLNAGYTRRRGDGSVLPETESLWAAAAGGPLAGAVGWDAELFGYPPTSGPAGHASVVGTLFGPTLTIRRWLILDAGVTVPVAGDDPPTVFFGGTWNVGHAFTTARPPSGP